MDYNILKLVIDRAGRVASSQNLSLNQCSTNNRIVVYYEGDFSYFEMSFRKPDGWLSDKVTLTFDVDPETYQQYAYYDIDEEFTSFVMSGRNGILVANLYLHTTIDGEAKVVSLGNIRINVNYVDDALVHTRYSETYINNINSQIGALQNDLIRFKTGDVLVGKAVADRKGNTIDIYYETKADALDKYDDLNQKKLDKTEVQDQTTRLQLLESNANTVNNVIQSIQTTNTNQTTNININSNDIRLLKEDKVSLAEFERELAERILKEDNLQSQIDDLSSSSNVTDIVGSYTDLQNYNTSQLEFGDRILVTTDKNHGEVSTIYRWTESGWEFIGKYASTSYSKTETDNIINTVRSTIPNKILTDGNAINLYKDSNRISDSQVSFKSINGESIFGNGNISTDNTDNAFSATSTNPVQNKLVTAALESKASILDLSTVRNELAEDIVNKQDKLTAGAGITITEDGLISVSTGLSFKKVDVLPSTGINNIIYLLKTTPSSYTEYIWIDDNWEPLGDATISLENYLTEAQILTLLSDKANQSNFEALSQTVSTNTTGIAGKADRSVVENLTSSVNTISNSLSTKVDSTDLDNYALKSEIPNISTKQDKLVSGENIKTINGVNILGYGDLLIADTDIFDLGNYVLNSDYEYDMALKADKSDLDYTKLSNKPNLEIFTTESEMEEYVADQIAAIPETDLTDYYTKDEVDDAIESHVPDLTGYATEEYVQNEINDILDNAPEAYNTLKEIADYISSDQSNAASMLASINQNTANISQNTGYIDNLETRFDQHIASNATEFANRYTKTEVNNLIDQKQDALEFKTINGESIVGNGNIEITGGTGSVDLTDYYDKDEVDTLISNKSKVVANPGVFTETLSSVTIDGTNYTVRTDLSNYYTKAQVDTAIENVSVDLTGYATENYVDNKVRDEITTLTNAAPEAYDTFKEIADYIESDLSNASAMLASINNKANKSEVYTQTEANAKFAEKSDIPTLPDMTQYYTKNETIDVIDKVSGLDNYYEKDEIDAALLNKQDILISGSTIKTIKGQSILGMGDLEVANVIPNPSLDGDEEILESIQIEDTKFSLSGESMIFSETTSEDPDAKVLKTISINGDDWNLEKGSIVTPNVELTGDEEVLESVQIDDTTFTLKGEEMIFSETSVSGATPLKNIQLGDDNWSLGSGVEPNPTLSGNEPLLTGLTIDNVNYGIYKNTLELSSEAIEGADELASITINGDSWNIVGSGSGSVDLSDYYTKDEVDEAIESNLPDLDGYATESYVNTKIADLVNSAPAALDTLGELATALQENESIIDTLNSAITDKADIDDVYTKEEIDEQFSNEITFSSTAAQGTELKSITVGNTVWSIPEGGNNETVDLTGYATESYVNTKIADLVNSAPAALDTLGELATALQENESIIDTLNSAITDKVDKIEGKGLSTNDFTDTEKTKLSNLSNYDDTEIRESIPNIVYSSTEPVNPTTGMIWLKPVVN